MIYLQRLRSLFGTTANIAESNLDGISLQSHKLLWITPFHHYKLSPTVYNPINSEICELTKNEYGKFINSNNYDSNSDAAIINNDFFKYQASYIRNKTHILDDNKFILNAGWNELEQSDSLKQLKDYIYKCILLYFKDCIQSEHELDILSCKHLNAYCWISVHLNDSFHPSHTHADSIISCVYYVRVPSDPHRIAFQDPKGIDLYNPESYYDIRPHPFDNEWFFKPTEGDLIIFPSWLAHRVVAPVENNTSASNIDIDNVSRLSLAINVLGSWKHNVAKHIDIT